MTINTDSYASAMYNQDPSDWLAPEDMSAAIVAKCHAVTQLNSIDDEIKRMRRLKKAWNQRLGVCLKTISKMTGTAKREGRRLPDAEFDRDDDWGEAGKSVVGFDK